MNNGADHTNSRRNTSVGGMFWSPWFSPEAACVCVWLKVGSMRWFGLPLELRDSVCPFLKRSLLRAHFRWGEGCTVLRLIP